MIVPLRLSQPAQKGGIELWPVVVNPLWASSSPPQSVAHWKPSNGARPSPPGARGGRGWFCYAPMAPLWRTWLARVGWRLGWSRNGAHATANRAYEALEIHLARGAPRAFPPQWLSIWSSGPASGPRCAAGGSPHGSALQRAPSCRPGAQRPSRRPRSVVCLRITSAKYGGIPWGWRRNIPARRPSRRR